MSHRFTTVRRHDGQRAPGLDLSRAIIAGFLIAAALGFIAGLGWLSYQFIRANFGG